MADHFLALSPDEIFELAERSSREDVAVGERAASPVPAESDELSSYRGVVERVTEVLTQQLDLPTFADWLELYRRNPGAVEARLIGFWKDAR